MNQMRLTVYILSLTSAAALLIFGVLGILGNAVSYKYELEDPAAETGIQKLEEKRNQLELQDYFFTGLVILALVTLVLLLSFRKKI